MKRPGSYMDVIADDQPTSAKANGRRLRRLPGQRRPTAHQVQRTSVTYELNADLVPIIRQVAQTLGLSPAGVVDRLLYHALQAFIQDDIDWDSYLRPSRSPQYTWVVDVPVAELQAAITQYLNSYFDDRED